MTRKFLHQALTALLSLVERLHTITQHPKHQARYVYVYVECTHTIEGIVYLIVHAHYVMVCAGVQTHTCRYT